jgi:hypothetical protein
LTNRGDEIERAALEPARDKRHVHDDEVQACADAAMFGPSTSVRWLSTASSCQKHIGQISSRVNPRGS